MDADNRYRLLFEHNPQPMWVYDAETLAFLAVNEAAVRRYGFSRQEFLEMTLREIRPREDVAVLEHIMASGEEVKRGEWRHRLSDGTVIDVEVSSEAVTFAGRPGRLVVALDVTDRKRARSELERRTAQQAAVAALGVNALEGMEVGELMDRAVEATAEMLGVELVELLELTPDREALLLRAGVGWTAGLVRQALTPLGSEFHAGFTWGSLGSVIVDDYATERRFRPAPLLRRHGAVSGLSVIVGGTKRPFGVLGAHSRVPRGFTRDELHFLQAVANVLADAIARRLSEERIRHQALHDPLTGLPNRTLLLERFNHWLDRAHRTQESAAVLFVDVDNFKLINDGLGHEVGDRLLGAVADRLVRTLRPSDTVARVGGDEFVVLCEDVGDERSALDLVARLMESFECPFELDGRDRHVSASVGIAMAGSGADATVVIGNADAAMYRAKERSGVSFELFDAGMRDRSLRRLETERELRAALDAGQLRNVYQPLVCPADGSPVGFEALVRWEHPERGTISPADFIPVAEESGLIVAIGERVLREACEEAMRWDRGLGISVNLSPRQVSDPGLVEAVAATLEGTGLEPGRLSLEITETVLINDGPSALQTLSRLKDLGVRLVLDDFGTGYSSLSHVKHFPIDVLKIDRSFVDGLGRDPEDSAIVTAVISMGRALGVHVVAEGVETEQQVLQLRSLGCPFAQGYHFARPLTPQAVTEFLGLADGPDTALQSAA
jgi:diguanylate cyclase (GGDEF)-like protein/PAS domain S-box-containing protein